jgi:hypothetical protein
MGDRDTLLRINASHQPESASPDHPLSSLPPGSSRPPKEASRRQASKIFDDHSITAGYESVPLIDIDTLPRGGISFETKAVGRVQVGAMLQFHGQETAAAGLALVLPDVCWIISVKVAQHFFQIFFPPFTYW